jgi:hypothetical protein
MGISAAMAHIVSGVQALTPPTGPDGFYCDEDATGAVADLEDVAAHRMRAFDLRLLSPPVDDGESGVVLRRLRAQLALRVGYPIAGDRGRLERIVAEDVGTISAYLPSIGTGAAANAAGIVTIYPVSSTDIVEGVNGQGEPVSLLATIIVEIGYREG